MRSDVLIVGAGPSGSSAAYHLASRGYHVVLADKNTFPRSKVCGDGLSPRGVRAMCAMGLNVAALAGPTIEGVRVIDPVSGCERISQFDELETGTVVPRIRLDAALCEAARTAGAEFCPGTTALQLGPANRFHREVQIRADGAKERVSAAFIVLADGSGGALSPRVLRSVSKQRELGFAVRQYFRGDTPLCKHFEFYFPLRVRGSVVAGYGWLFPMGEQLLNVGLGFVPEANRAARLSIRIAYEHFISQPRVAEQLAHLRPISPLIGGPVRYGFCAEQTIESRLLLVGDAAALVNPFTGEGIAQAIESGAFAAEAIDECLRAGRTVADGYVKKLRDRFRRHENLRASLPQLFDALRYSKLRTIYRPGRRGFLSKALSRVAQDLDRPPAAGLRSVIWDGVFEEPTLRRRQKSLEAATLARLGARLPALAELSFHAREELYLLPGYLGALVLAASERTPQPEQAEHMALVVELVPLSIGYHADVCAGGRDRPAQRYDALSLLLGDTTITTVFEALNLLDVPLACRLSRAVADYAADLVAGRIPDDGVSSCNTGRGYAAFASAVVMAASECTAATAAVSSLLGRWTLHHARAMALVHDAWLELDAKGAAFHRLASAVGENGSVDCSLRQAQDELTLARACLNQLIAIGGNEATSTWDRWTRNLARALEYITA